MDTFPNHLARKAPIGPFGITGRITSFRTDRQ